MPANRSTTAWISETYPLRVTYDAQAVVAPDQHIGKGIHLRNLLGSHIEQFVGIAPGGKQESSLPIVQSGFSNYLIWQQTSLPLMLFSLRPDVFVAPFNTAPLLFPKRTKLLLIVHDLITFEQYRNVGIRFRLLLRYWRSLTSTSIRHAFMVITVSEYSREQILQRFPKARVVVLPNSISESWYVRQNATSVRDRENYILMVSAMSPHKNIQRGLQAYSAYVSDVGLSCADLRVVGISKTNAANLQPRLRELGISDRVHFMPYLSELELQRLYRRAKALFIPSLMEGFGIPVLEAMASGTPVISSSATSLPEVGGSAPEYCDPYDATDICRVLTRVLADDDLRAGMAERGLSQAETFHPHIVQNQINRFWADLPNLNSSTPLGIDR
jgi:glycosyltransferase involved in cell wall biosynthesis